MTNFEAMEVKWIKIVTDIFDDEKILLIEHLPEADSIIVCWFKLLCLAGKQNNSGVLMLNDRIAYTDEMLATVFRRPLQTVRLALDTFENFGMIEIVNGAITIPNWGKHQSLDRLEKLRDYQREYHREYRKKQELLPEQAQSKLDRKLYVNDTEEDIEEEIDKDIEIEEEREKSGAHRISDLDQVIEAWNTLGLTKVTKVTADSQRGQWLHKRIKDYGLAEVLRAIDNVRRSKFLMGDNKKGWQITFDWFLRPNNFPKVLDGNYSDYAESAPAPAVASVPKNRKYTTAEEYKAEKAKEIPVSPDELWKMVDMI